MHGAQLLAWGEAPNYVELASPPLPSSKSTETQIQVAAVGLHHLVRTRALGKHYSATALPHFPGIDGTGTTTDGRDVYFLTLPSGTGSFMDLVNVPSRDIFELPPNSDKIQIAAVVNNAVSSWMALKRRTIALPPGFTVLILGVTSASGAVAVPLVRLLGAGKVIGCGRNAEKLATLNLDQALPLLDPTTATDFASIDQVDVILDYIYGPATVHLLNSLKPTHHVQYIQIGSVAATDIVLPADTLRSKNITLTGSGIGSFSPAELRAEIPGLLEAVQKLPPHQLNVVPLSDVKHAWDQETSTTTVFTL